MSLLHKNESLLRLGADDWLIPDIQSAYEATDFAYDLGDKVAIDSIWTVGRRLRINFANPAHVDTKILDRSAALRLADIDLARYALDDELLSQRERTMKALLPAVNASHDTLRYGLAEAFTRLGGIAVISGSLEGITAAHRNYDALVAASHPGILPAGQ